MSILANHWAAAGHEVSLATFERPEQDFFELDSRVRRFVIGDTGTPGVAWLRANRARLRALRRAIRDSNAAVLLSFLYPMNLLAIAAARGLVPVVVSERTDPRHKPIERWQAVLRRVLYPMASAVVVQTEEVLDGWALDIARGSRAYAIPNPALVPSPACWRGDPASGPVVASIGRLEHGKGFDVLLAAFSRVATDHRDWSLVIMGEGEKRAALTAQAAAYGLLERVFMPGTGDTSALFARSDVFAMASRVEGFPNALLEAMAAGLPIVATDCHSGPREIVREGLDGYLVPVDDVDRYAGVLRRLLEDPDLRRRCGTHAAEVVDRFQIDRVAAQWEQVFTEVERH